MEKYCEIFRQIYAGNNIEDVIEMLKKSGATQMDTLKVLMDELNISLKDADNIVLNAAAWRDTKEFNEELRETFADILKNRPSEN